MSRLSIGLLILALAVVLVLPREGRGEPLPAPEGCLIPVDTCPDPSELELANLSLQFVGACVPTGVGPLIAEDDQQCCYEILANCDAVRIEEEEERGCGG